MSREALSRVVVEAVTLDESSRLIIRSVVDKQTGGKEPSKVRIVVEW